MEERPALLQIEDVRPKRDWAEVARPELASGESLLEQVDGEPVLFLKLAKSLYAYRPDCPSCHESLAGVAAEEGAVACPGCGTRYDVRRAGRSLDGSALQLAPVPLLDDGNGAMKVALALTLATSRLRQIARAEASEREAVAERCDLCGEPIPDDHRHLLDLDSREVSCSCRACSLLFDRPAAEAATTS